MKPYLLFAVLLVLPLTACESPTAPEAVEKQEIPADARVIERIVHYQGSVAKIGLTSATVDFAVPELTASAYAVRVYYEEVGTWVLLPSPFKVWDRGCKLGVAFSQPKHNSHAQ